MKKIALMALLAMCGLSSCEQEVKYNTPEAGNPIIPGYFADPTVRKFGDTYYLYATTDGNGGGLGPSQVWTSKDFVNWTIQPMNWPDTHFIWAPDVMQGKDGKYSSADGKVWANMRGSPFYYSKAAQKSVKLGLYQVTYTPDKGYVSFGNFKLWTLRNFSY